MKRGTKIGWLLVAVSVIMCVWVIASQKATASVVGDGFLVDDNDPARLTGYDGPGGDIIIPDGIERIDAGVFANKSSLTGINLNGVTTLGSGVFKGCNNLRAVNLGNHLTSIPADTFWGCNSLNSVTIPNSVTEIGGNAFYGCASISSITIPSSVTNLSRDAFTQCGNLSNITVNNGGTYSSADGCVYNSARTLLIVPIGKTSVSIAAGTREIATGAFKDCVNLHSLNIPSGVIRIQNDAFSGSGISSITVPASVEVFGTQSNWAPTTIYGYADSVAEQYAMDHNILFEVIDTDPGNVPGTDTPGNNSQDNPSGSPDNPQQGDVVHPDGSITHPDGSTTHPDGSVTYADGTHVKDATPTTADGLDPRYYLCFAIFAGGVGVILYSRMNKLKYVSQKHENH